MPKHGPSDHLSWDEISCNDGTPYPIEWRATRAVFIGIAFESIRKLCGNSPIRVNSAYRTLSWNRKSRSKDTSQHPKGLALDLSPPKGMSVWIFHENILAEARKTKLIRGVGLYKWGVHIDCRASKRLCRWRGSRITAEGDSK